MLPSDTNLTLRARCALLVISALGGALLAGACGGGSNGSAPVEAAGSVTLGWTRPAFNADGSPLQDGVGYRVDYGSSPSSLTMSITIDGAANTSATIGGLLVGTHYFTVVTLNAAGTTSSPSGVVSKTVP